MPMMAPTVTMPVPPTPVTMTLYGWLVSGASGFGSADQDAGSATLSPCLSLAPCTVTKDGQKPLRQE